jgi:glycosyltransferase involved in cell wall biosynthesis
MAVVSVSKWLDSMVDASFLTDKQRHVIYNGIDVEVFSPMTDIDELREKYNLQNKKVLIGVASVWDKYKGYDDYLRLHEMLPDNTQLIMVGLSEKQLNALPKGIIGLQRTQNVEELVKLYSLADIVLNLSSF